MVTPLQAPGVVKAVVVVVVATLCFVSVTLTYQRYQPFMVWEKAYPITTAWHQFLCGNKLSSLPDSSITFPQLMRNVTPDRKDTNVFLIDSACNVHPKYRAWCSVESWARQNPGLDVWYLQTAPVTDDTDSLPTHLLNQYENLHVAGIDLDYFFRETPLNPLFTSRQWTDSRTWPVNHLSDMSRVVALWHWGGIYTDTDIICIKNYTLPLSHVGLEQEGVIGNALLSFTHHHPLLWKLMDYMNSNFQLRVWGSIGPKAVTAVVKEVCPNGDISVSGAPHSCTNLTVHHPSAFFPYPWREYRHYFQEGDGKDIDKALPNSYAFHIWNKMSKEEVVRVGSDSIYEAAAKRFCPITYHQATLRSNTF